MISDMYLGVEISDRPDIGDMSDMGRAQDQCILHSGETDMSDLGDIDDMGDLYLMTDMYD